MSGVREPNPQRWPRWTAGPGAGGRYKQSPEDFEVDELPWCRPGTDGEHRWLLVEKIDYTTPEVADILARLCGVPRSEVGYAGLKDRAARTRQVFTVPGQGGIGTLPTGIRLLESGRTRHKLRIGQLRGNRFRIRVNGGDPRIAQQRAALLSESGLPNYYGPQRLANDSAERGYQLLLGEARPGPIEETRFALSAWQALQFNRVLAERGRARLGGDLLEDGDPTGPMYGWSMQWPQGEALDLEERILNESGVPYDALNRFPALTRGTRRPLWVPVAPRIEPDADGFWLHVRLPPGSYATVVLDELL